MSIYRAARVFHAMMFSVWFSFTGRADLTIESLTPTNQSVNVCTDTPLQLRFNQPVVLGNEGRIAIYRAIDNKLMDAFDLSAAGYTNSFGGKTLHYDAIHIANKAVTVQLHSHALSSGDKYYVTVERGAFKSKDGREFAGFANKSHWIFSTRASAARGRTRLVVAADGTGDFCTAQGAVDDVADDNQLPVEIFIRKGFYEGMVYVPPDKSHLHFVGEDRTGTVITGRNNDRFNPTRIDRALVSVDADDFVLENMTLQNTTPRGGSQAEALRVHSDRCVLRNDDFRSIQDTLLLSGRVYVTNCYVEGDVDFIWGQGSVFLDQCEIRAIHDGYYLQARNPEGRLGYVFFKCKLTAAPEVEHCLLARIEADRFPFSQAVFIHCQMGAHVPPIGWETTGTNLSQLCFWEFENTDAEGHPINVSQRHRASRQLAEAEASELSNPAKVLSYQYPWNPGMPCAPGSKPKP